VSLVNSNIGYRLILILWMLLALYKGTRTTLLKKPRRDIFNLRKTKLDFKRKNSIVELILTILLTIISGLPDFSDKNDFNIHYEYSSFFEFICQNALLLITFIFFVVLNYRFLMLNIFNYDEKYSLQEV
ncbi:MAG: hypothetical protein LBN22_09330, partial [Clostridiales Family XIII bacterium]|nr:hypothetical protein [Clostridiales Family XIII bacterium]